MNIRKILITISIITAIIIASLLFYSIYLDVKRQDSTGDLSDEPTPILQKNETPVETGKIKKDEPVEKPTPTSIIKPKPILESMDSVIDKESRLLLKELGPELSIISPIEKSIFRSKIILIGSVSNSKVEADNSGNIKKLEWSITNSTLSGKIKFNNKGYFNISIPTIGLQGTRILIIKAEDKKKKVIEKRITLIDDGIGPYLNITSPLDMSYYKSTVFVKGSVRNGIKEKSVNEIQKLFWEVLDTELSGEIKYSGRGNFSFNISTVGLSKTIVLRIIAQDKNKHLTEKSFTLQDDGVGPFLQVSLPAEKSYYKDSIVLKGSVSNDSNEKGKVSEVKSLYYSFPAAPLLRGDISYDEKGNFSMAVKTDKLIGTQLLEIIAMDKNGNKTSFSVTLLKEKQLIKEKEEVLTSPPYLEIISPEDRSYYHSRIIVKGRVSNSIKEKDNYNQVTMVRWELLGMKKKGIAQVKEEGFFRFRIATSGLQGTKVVKILVENKDGLVSEKLMTFLDDGIGPYLQIFSPKDKSFYKPAVIVKGRVSNLKEDVERTTEINTLAWEVVGTQSNGKIKYKKNGHFKFTFSTVGLPKTIILKIEAADKNSYITERTLTLLNDGIGPFITIKSPQDNSYYSETITVKGTISDMEKDMGKIEDVKSIYWTIPGWDEKPNLIFFDNKGVFTFDVSTKDISGLITLEISAEDMHSNLSKYIIKMQDGKITPALVISSPSEGSKFGAFITVKGIVSDPYKNSKQYGGIDSLTYKLASSEYFDLSKSDIKGNIPLDSAGKFNFNIPAFNLKGKQVLMLKVEAKNKNIKEKSINIEKGKSDIPSFSVEPENTQIVLKWDNIPLVTDYTIYHTSDGSEPDGKKARQLKSVTSPYRFKNLINGYLYSFKLKASLKEGNIWSHVEKTIPLSPRTLKPVVKGEYKQIKISWKSLPGTGKYKLLRATEKNSDFHSISGILEDYSYIDKYIQFGKRYYYKVIPAEYERIKSEATGGESLSSPPVRVEVINKIDIVDTQRIAVSGDYAYIASGSKGLVIVDFSDVTSVKEVGSVLTNNAKDVIIKGDYAYIADGNKGIKVVNISDPLNPILVGSRNTTDACGIDIKGSYIFLADGEKGLKILDVSDSRHPERVSFLDSIYANRLKVEKNYVYIAAGSNGIQIVDIKDVFNPELLGSIKMKDARDIVIMDSYAYVADGKEGLKVIDILDPAKPYQVSYYKTKNAIGISINSDYLFIADDLGGVKILDISDPLFPKEFDSIKVDRAFSVYTEGEYAYIVDSKGLKVVQTYLYGRSFQIASCKTEGKAYGIKVKGDYAYLCDHQGGVKIIEISKPESIGDESIIASCNTEFAVSSVITDDYLYVADGVGGLKIVDITPVNTNRNNIKLNIVGSCEIPGSAESIQVDGNFVYVGARGGGLNIIDTGSLFKDNKDAIPYKAGIFHSEDVRDIDIIKNYIYLADGKSGLKIIDISNPSEPSLVGLLEDNGAWGIKVRDKYAYMIGFSGLSIIDIRDPEKPVLIKKIETNYAEKLIIDKNYLYIAEGYKGIRVIDISDPADPRQVSACDTVYAVGLDVKGDFAFVVDSYGLRVVQIFIPEWLR